MPAATKDTEASETLASLTTKRKALAERRTSLADELADAHEKAGQAQTAIAEGRGKVDAAAEAQGRAVVLEGALAQLDRSIGEVDEKLEPFEQEREQRRQEKLIRARAGATAAAYQKMLRTRAHWADLVREFHQEGPLAYLQDLRALRVEQEGLIDAVQESTGETYLQNVVALLADLPGAGEDLFGLRTKRPHGGPLSQVAGTMDLPKVTGWEAIADTMASRVTLGTAD